jgi:hypothetical protein
VRPADASHDVLHDIEDLNGCLDLGIEFSITLAGINFDDQRKAGNEILRIGNGLGLPPACNRMYRDQIAASQIGCRADQFMDVQ